MIRICEYPTDKKCFLDLLLLSDGPGDMVGRYLELGDLYALYDDDVLCCVAVVTGYGPEDCELKSIATNPKRQGQGYGRMMVTHLANRYRGRCHRMYVGTGDTPKTVGFYRACGFRPSHRLRNFFTDNFYQPILEDGVRLVDMVYLCRELS